MACVHFDLAVPRGGLFDAATGPDLLQQIDRMFGTPCPLQQMTGEDRKEWREKNIASLRSRLEGKAPDGCPLAPDGPEAVMRRLTPDGDAVLTNMLRPDPAGRLSITGVVHHPYCNMSEMHCTRHTQGEQGSFSLVTGKI